MAIKRISELNDWELVHDEQDIRGWEMHDEADEKVGTVTDLVADTDQEMITKVILDNGKEFSAREIQIAEGVVYVRGTHAETQSGPVVKVYDDARVRRSTTAGSAVVFTDHADEFRTHHKSNYADSGRDYSVYEPAYRTGFDYGIDTKYRDRDYSDLESEMRRSYEKKHGEGTWDRAEDAARHAFRKARNLGESKQTSTGTTGTRTREGVS